jgi:hypothetical protein
MPKNYNLCAVNFVMAGTGLYQLYRKYSADQEAKALVEGVGAAAAGNSLVHNSAQPEPFRPLSD